MMEGCLQHYLGFRKLLEAVGDYPSSTCLSPPGGILLINQPFFTRHFFCPFYLSQNLPLAFLFVFTKKELK